MDALKLIQTSQFTLKVCR